MTERELKQIHINNRILASLQAEYTELCGCIGMSPMQADGMPRGSTSKDGMPDVERKVDIEIEYKRLYHENERLIAKSRKYISQFPDETLRRMLTHRYINALGIDEIAADAGLSMRECEEVFKVHFNNLF